MALSGRFDADFSQFYDAVRQAEVSLRSFDAGAQRVEKSLNRMVDSFSGRRVIQDATLMAEAVSRIGSPARLTANELQRVGASAAEAAEKMRRMGIDVPPKIDALAAAAKRAEGGIGAMGTSIRQVDNVLGLFGVNLGPVGRAMQDFGGASGQTVAQLGALATGVLAASAAMAGWKIGRFIADFAQTDEIIGNATAKLLGWGDVAAEKAALKADMLAKASKEVGFQVTTLSTAMAVNEAAAKDTIAANEALSATFKAEAEAAKKAGEEIARVHTANNDKFQQTVRDFIKGMHEQEEADRKRAEEATANAKKRQDAEHEAAVKSQEDWAKSRNAFMEAEAQKKAAAEATALAMREQRLEAERLARNATTFANFDDPQAARALLARPERSREDFIRMYAGYSGGLEFAEQQYQTEQEIRRRARRVVEADDARRAEENRRWSGGGAMGSGGSADVNIQVSGLLDPRTVDELSRQVGAAIVTRLGKVPLF